MRNCEWILILILAALLVATSPARAVESRSAATDTNAAAKAKLSDDELGDLLQQASMLARVGRYDEAEACCKQILAQKPAQPIVKQLLSGIEEKRAQVARSMPRVELRRQLENLIVPEVILREAAVADVIEFSRLSYRIDSHAVVIYVPEGTEPAKAAPAPGDQHGQP